MRNAMVEQNNTLLLYTQMSLSAPTRGLWSTSQVLGMPESLVILFTTNVFCILYFQAALNLYSR
jgi:hypothetical protein